MKKIRDVPSRNFFFGPKCSTARKARPSATRGHQLRCCRRHAGKKIFPVAGLGVPVSGPGVPCPRTRGPGGPKNGQKTPKIGFFSISWGNPYKPEKWPFLAIFGHFWRFSGFSGPGGNSGPGRKIPARARNLRPFFPGVPEPDGPDFPGFRALRDLSVLAGFGRNPYSKPLQIFAKKVDRFLNHFFSKIFTFFHFFHFCNFGKPTRRVQKFSGRSEKCPKNGEKWRFLAVFGPYSTLFLAPKNADFCENFRNFAKFSKSRKVKFGSF